MELLTKYQYNLITSKMKVLELMYEGFRIYQSNTLTKINSYFDTLKRVLKESYLEMICFCFQFLYPLLVTKKT